MHFQTLIAILSVASTAIASAPLDLLARDTSCSTPNGSGTCQHTSSCKTKGFSVAGHCPGSASIQCCVEKSCTTSSGSGTCLSTSQGCSGGSFVAGACPGSSSIQCCVTQKAAPVPAPAPAPSSSGSDQSSSKGSSNAGSDKGTAIVNAAKKEEGLPYVYGGGGCSGPSKGGFDCSGLTQYAICKAVGITIPRTADAQYAAKNGKHIPRSQAKAGDLIFWATGGKCSSAVEHVGIVMGTMKDGYMVNAAHTGTPVREQAIWTSSGGLSICPDAVRFY